MSRPPPAIRLSTPTYTMLSAMIGSTSRAGGVTTLRTASDSVMLCATVKAVTTSSNWRTPPPSSSRPMRNSRWSGPIRMWWTPDGTNFCSTASTPCRVPEKYS